MRLIERRPRDRRKVGPTEFGKLLIPHAVTIAKDLQALKSQFDNLLGLRHTLVRFAASPTAMKHLATPALRSFRAKRPKFRVQAMQMVLPSIISRLREGAFDFVITDEPDEPMGDEFIVERVLTDHAALIAGPQHPLVGLSPKKLTDTLLSQQRWIGFGPFMPTMTGFQQLFNRLGKELPARVLETSSIDITLSELRSNAYLCALPIELVRHELQAKDFCELPVALEPLTGWPISIIRPAERPLSPATADLLDMKAAAG